MSRVLKPPPCRFAFGLSASLQPNPTGSITSDPLTLITPEFLSESIRDVRTPIDSEEHIGKTLREIVAQVEAQVIRRTLANNTGKRARSAKELGITREGLYN